MVNELKMKSKVTESKTMKKESKEVNRANALLDLFNEVYDGMGDMYAIDEWAEVLADEYGLNNEDDEYDEDMDAEEVIITALNMMDDKDFRGEVDNFVDGLFENEGIDYLKDTLHIYPRNLKHIIKCLNTIKPYASEPDKIDKAIEELQGVNMDLRTTAEEFQRYLHDNYKPWTVLGSTSGPRTYVNLFEVPTDYDIVGADYFNYAGRPSDMLENIGYGWKQDGNNIVADLIGFTHSVEEVGDNGGVAVYDQAPVKYGYSATIDSSNKEEKFKEMANALMSKAKEIKEKYKLGESKKVTESKKPEATDEKQYEVSLAVKGYYKQIVWAKDEKEAYVKVDNLCADADFGKLEDIEWEKSRITTLDESKKVTETIDEDKTKVIFRKELEDGDIIAVFPEDKQGNDMIGCYAHMGQHSTMSLEYYKETVPATPEEYKDLKAELENIVGYNLEVVTELDESKKVTESKTSDMDTADIVMELEGGELTIADVDDWNTVKEVAKSLQGSQGFYGRLLRSMLESEEEFGGVENLPFPITM